MSLPDGFMLVPALFDAATSREHLAALLTELQWEEQRFTIYGRAMPMPRLIAMYGPAGYRYSGVVHPPRPLPPRLDTIRRYGVIIDLADGSLLPRTTEQFRAMMTLRSAAYWTDPVASQ